MIESRQPGNVVVTGTPGVNLKAASTILVAAGYRVLHDKQIYAKDRKHANFFSESGRNLELVDRLKALFDADTDYPMFFLNYYPPNVIQSLEDFVSKFSRFQPVAFVDVLIAPYLELFRPFANYAVFVRESAEADLEAIRKYCGLIPSDIEVKIRDIALNRAEERLKSFDSVLELDARDVAKLEKSYPRTDFW